jgi:hypothetical protein
MSARTWLLFALTEVALCHSPGPAVLLVVSRALALGTRASIWSKRLALVVAHVELVAGQPISTDRREGEEADDEVRRLLFEDHVIRQRHGPRGVRERIGARDKGRSRRTRIVGQFGAAGRARSERGEAQQHEHQTDARSAKRATEATIYRQLAQLVAIVGLGMNGSQGSSRLQSLQCEHDPICIALDKGNEPTTRLTNVSPRSSSRHGRPKLRRHEQRWRPP